MTISPSITETKPTIAELKRLFGEIAILEGEDHITHESNLENVNELLKPSLAIFNMYKDYSLFPELAKMKIDTIVIDSTFTHTKKIMSAIEGLIELYKQTGWKPKNIVNTMEYGLHILYMLGEALDINVYSLCIHNFKDEKEVVSFLKKIDYDDDAIMDLHIKYDEFSELLKEKKLNTKYL